MNESNDDIRWPVGSTVDDIGPLWYLSYCTLVPCVIAGFVTNIFFIVVSQEVFNQRPTIPNLLLKYLAWTDVLNCSFGVVPIILAYHLKIFTKGVCAFHGTVFSAFSVASQMIVALMSIDRYIALVHPFFYSKCLVKRHGKMAIAVYIILVYSAVSASLPLFGLNRNIPHPPNSFCMFDWADRTPKGRLVVYLNLLNMFLCLLIIMIMNGVVGMYMYRLRRVRPTQVACVSSETGTQPPADSLNRRLQLQMTKMLDAVEDLPTLHDLYFGQTTNDDTG
ncbi:PTGIR [Branchiostoma lanceolatum]|uniref:PTGIR protein n=1 Tax=Branchiostoma lanceolatum TaxID=7740 RepID=A0A8K0AEF5_BRALA|nr:PTGIR [Branchiostoma lanceolatum]